MTHRSTHDSIAEIAYKAWVDRGQPYGSPEVDWYYALSVVSDPETIRTSSSDQLSFDSGESESLDEQESQPALSARGKEDSASPADAMRTKDNASSSRSMGSRKRNSSRAS